MRPTKQRIERMLQSISEPNLDLDLNLVVGSATDPARGRYMHTFSGRPYWPTDPRPEDVRIVDIAHHLSMLCRYTGAVRRFYSVAEHSVLVSLLVPPQFALCGLLHDAPEAYLADLNRPVKHGPGMTYYNSLDRLNWCAVAMHFGLPTDMPREVVAADNGLCLLERDALLTMPSAGWDQDWNGVTPHPNIGKVAVRALLPEQAESAFLERFYEVTRRRQA